jgi:hypothetical protein
MTEMTKAEREAANLAATKEAQRKAREAAYLAKANYGGEPGATVEPPATVAPVAEDAPEPAEAPATPEPAPEAAKAPAKPSAARKTTREQPGKAPAPWANAHPKVKAYFSTQFPDEYDLKMQWICQNLPQMSKQKIVHDAVGAYLDKLIAEHYKP